jgi:hypothetical protein
MPEMVHLQIIVVSSQPCSLLLLLQCRLDDADSFANAAIFHIKTAIACCYVDFKIWALQTCYARNGACKGSHGLTPALQRTGAMSIGLMTPAMQINLQMLLYFTSELPPAYYVVVFMFWYCSSFKNI